MTRTGRTSENQENDPFIDEPMGAPDPPDTLHPSLFSTPRRRKSPSMGPSPSIRLAIPRPWPRLRARVDRELISDVCEEIFGYRPHKSQLDLMEYILEGRDCIGVSGTGSGKSLVFALVAIAAELAQQSGVVFVICPLKALQNDQVS